MSGVCQRVSASVLLVCLIILVAGCSPAPRDQVHSSFSYIYSGKTTLVVAQGTVLPDWFVQVASEAWDAASERISETPLSAGLTGMVVEVPADYETFKQVMGVTDDGLREQAALTWFTKTPLEDGTVEPDVPRVVVNPLWSSALAQVDREAALLVLTHEAVHVVTGVRASASGRLWVAEGVAEFVALAGDATALAASEGLVKELCPDTLQLPADDQFRSSELAYDLAALLVKLTLDDSDYATLQLWWDGGGDPEATLTPFFVDWCN